MNVLRPILAASLTIAFAWSCHSEPQQDKIVKTIPIGRGAAIIDLPVKLHTEDEGDDTVLAFIPNKDFANLRFTVLTIKSKNETDTALGVNFIQKRSKEKKLGTSFVNDKVVVFYQEDSVQDGEKIIMKYWKVGFGNSVVIISCCIIGRMKDNPVAVEVVGYVPDIIKSIRRKD